MATGSRGSDGGQQQGTGFGNREGRTGAGEAGEEESRCRAVLRVSVLKGNRNGIAAQTREALSQGEEASALLNEILLPAINQVGELFDRGKYFLPQLIASAEAMKRSIEVLEPLLRKETDTTDMPAVVIATVSTAASYILAALGRETAGEVTTTVFTACIGYLITYAAKSATEKISRNRHGLDEDGMPISETERKENENG